MKRGREQKKRRRESAELCRQKRNGRTDKEQMAILDSKGLIATKERNRLSKGIVE